MIIKKIVTVNGKMTLLWGKKPMDIKTGECRDTMNRYKLIAEGASDGIWDWDILYDKALITKKWSDMLGFPTEEIHNYSNIWKNLVHRNDLDRVCREFNRCLEEKAVLYQCEYRIRLKSRQFKWISSRGKILWDNRGRAVRIAGSITDISDQKSIEKKLEDLSYYDQLTGLPLRSVFRSKLKEALQNVKRNGTQLVVYMIDVDDLKIINELYGHETGDVYLRKISRKLATCAKKCDFLGRFGGDEFIMYALNSGSSAYIEERAGQIQELVNQAIIIRGHSIYSSISIGIAVSSVDGYSDKELIKKAEYAMYKAKDSGKNRFLFFNEHMELDHKITYEMKKGLVKSIRNNEFFLCYQPIFDFKKNKVIAAEALIRWEHPQLGLISPVDFIPIAEQSKLIIPLGNWVLEEACRQMKIWREMDLILTVSVNVSVIQLQQPGFSDIVSELLMRYQLLPQFLELEMTESILIGYDRTVDHNLRALSILGVNLAIDDFGTGYNSFQCIQNDLFNRIKIDKEFIMNMESGTNRSIVDMIIYLGHRIKIAVTAEGVENENQYDYLKKTGCDSVQGYYISRPCPSKELIRFMLQS